MTAPAGEAARWAGHLDRLEAALDAQLRWAERPGDDPPPALPPPPPGALPPVLGPRAEALRDRLDGARDVLARRRAEVGRELEALAQVASAASTGPGHLAPARFHDQRV